MGFKKSSSDGITRALKINHDGFAIIKITYDANLTRTVK